MTKITLVAFTFFLLPNLMLADGCENYPLNDGISIEETPTGIKIMSTATRNVITNDRQEIISSMRAAELIAKAGIAKFMNETIQSEEILNEQIDKVEIIGGEQASQRTTVIEQLLAIRSQSSAMLRGAVRIGDCYTKNEYAMVTVGLKPETISQADSLGSQIMNGTEQKNDSNNGIEGNLGNAPKSSSNTKGIANF